MLFQGYGDLAKTSQMNLDNAMTLASDVTKGWQAIAVELTDYSKRTLEQNTAVFEKLFAARSLEQALDIQASHAKRSYDDYVQQMSRLNGILADLTKTALKPVEKTFAIKA